MRRVSRLGVAVWTFVSLGGCAAFAGLDQLQKDDGGATLDATADTLDSAADAPQESADSSTADARSDVRDAPSDGCTGLVSHDDGLGHTFCDSVPAGTINQQLALDACKAFTGSASLCSTADCVNASTDAGNGDSVECSSGSPTDCVCWTYQGPDIGFVHDGTSASMCFCSAGGSDPKFK